MATSEKKWHIDKTIPLAIILAILSQTAGAFWWASKVDSYVTSNTSRIIKLETAIMENRQLADRLVRVEVRQESANELLNKIVRKLYGE